MNMKKLGGYLIVIAGTLLTAAGNLIIQQMTLKELGTEDGKDE